MPVAWHSHVAVLKGCTMENDKQNTGLWKKLFLSSKANIIAVRVKEKTKHINTGKCTLINLTACYFLNNPGRA
jgi:hypothetical protein